MKTRKIIFLSLLFFMLAFRLLPMFSNSGHNSLPQKSVNDTTTSPNEHTDFIVEQINKAEREKELTNLGNLSELIEKKELEEKQTQTLYAGEFKSVNKINTTGFISIEKTKMKPTFSSEISGQILKLCFFRSARMKHINLLLTKMLCKVLLATKVMFYPFLRTMLLFCMSCSVILIATPPSELQLCKDRTKENKNSPPTFNLEEQAELCPLCQLPRQ